MSRKTKEIERNSVQGLLQKGTKGSERRQIMGQRRRKAAVGKTTKMNGALAGLDILAEACAHGCSRCLLPAFRLVEQKWTLLFSPCFV